MMHLITDNGYIWVAATSIVGVRRSSAEYAIVTLKDGKVVSSRERYERFVERLNNAWLRASGTDRSLEPCEGVVKRVIEPSSKPMADQEEVGAAFGLDPVLT